MQPIAQTLTDDARRYAADVLAAARRELDRTSDDGADALALAGIARATDLLAGEIALFDGERGHLAPVLGRTLIETCLWAQYLLLEPDDALERLYREVGDQKRRIKSGSIRLSQLQPLSGAISDFTAEWPDAPLGGDLATMAEKVDTSRQDLGFCETGGWAVVAYQQEYRWRSAHEDHAGLAVFGRYWTPDHDTVAVRDTPHAYPDASDPLVSNDDFLQDTHLLQDSIALRVALTGRAQLVGTTGARLVLLDLDRPC